MRKSIIIGLISLIVTVVAFIFAFIVFEKGKTMRIKLDFHLDKQV